MTMPIVAADWAVIADALAAYGEPDLSASARRLAKVSPSTDHNRCINAVSTITGIEPRQMIGPSRKRPIVNARHAAIWLCRERAGMSLKSIGAAFNRDHTSIMHAVDRVETQLRIADPWFVGVIGSVDVGLPFNTMKGPCR